MKLNKIMTKRRLTLMVASTSIMLSSLAIAAPANAATTGSSTTPEQNCGVFIDTGVTVCVPVEEDLHAGVQAQTGRTVVIAETSAARAQAEASAASTSYLLGRLYDDRNYGGSYKEFYGLNAGCSGDGGGFGFSDIGSSWYGRVSSFRGYSNCSVKIFELTGYRGATFGFFASSTFVGNAMNDRTKSVQFS